MSEPIWYNDKQIGDLALDNQGAEVISLGTDLGGRSITEKASVRSTLQNETTETTDQWVRTTRPIEPPNLSVTVSSGSYIIEGWEVRRRGSAPEILNKWVECTLGAVL